MSKRAKWNSLVTEGSANSRFKLGAAYWPALELHGMADPVAGRQLRQAEPVAEGIEAQGLGVDRHQLAQVKTVGQVALMQMNFHLSSSSKAVGH